VLAETFHSELIALMQVVGIDLVLAGDNAIVVGMAACGVAAEQRRKVICWGIFAAVVLRIGFAAITTQLLAIIGLTLAGGILLLWVCWKLYRELREQHCEDAATELYDGDPATADCGAGIAVSAAGIAVVAAIPRKTVRQAIVQVAVADLSMSLDNVLAVAGAAGEHMSALVVGLTLSVVLMGIGASVIARLLQSHRWLGYLGLVLIAYVAGKMIVDGGMEVTRAMAGL
jgi:YjbE family integral membrane protein